MYNTKKIAKLNARRSEAMTKISKTDRVALVPCGTRVSDPVEEDRRLTNWRRWLTDRERRQQHLVKTLKRGPLELALNAHEMTRSKSETRTLIEAASTSEVTNQDQYRGNPVFWKNSQRLCTIGCDREKEGLDEEEDDVVVTMNRCAKYLPPDLTRVAVPSLILKEKKLLDSCVDSKKPIFNSQWERGDYLHQRRDELKREIKILEPKKPETNHLVIEGKNFQCGKKEKFLRLPVISITADDDTNKLLNDPDNRMALKIKKREFVFEKGHFFEKLSREESENLRESKEDQDVRKYAYSVFDSIRVYKILTKKMPPATWSLSFHANGDELCQRKFVFENKGVYVFTIDWRNVTPRLSTIPDRVESCFFFNKNLISVLPGQKATVLFWFHSERATVATETWDILVEPPIYRGRMSLRLWGVADGGDLKDRQEEKGKRVMDHLKERVKRSIVRDIIEELLVLSTSDPLEVEVPYSKLFLETDIFHLRNPAHFYNSVLVEELKCMYKTVTCQDDWSLALRELRAILLKVENNEVRREMMLRFNDICTQCLLPSGIYESPICSKDRLIYWLLCAGLNKFEEESSFVWSTCCWQLTSDDSAEGEGSSEAGEGETESSLASTDLALYYEVFYIRIYHLMCETIDRICAALDLEVYSGERISR